MVLRTMNNANWPASRSKPLCLQEIIDLLSWQHDNVAGSIEDPLPPRHQVCGAHCMDFKSSSGADVCCQEIMDAPDQPMLTSQPHINATCAPEQFAEGGKLPVNIVEETGADIRNDR